METPLEYVCYYLQRINARLTRKTNDLEENYKTMKEERDILLEENSSLYIQAEIQQRRITELRVTVDWLRMTQRRGRATERTPRTPTHRRVRRRLLEEFNDTDPPSDSDSDPFFDRIDNVIDLTQPE